MSKEIDVYMEVLANPDSSSEKFDEAVRRIRELRAIEDAR